MDNRNNIEFEDNLGRRFDPQNIRSEGWNEPSDIVWENVQNEIYKSNTKNRYLSFILFNLLVVSLGVLGFVYFQNIQLKSELEKTEKERDYLVELKAIAASTASEPTIEEGFLNSDVNEGSREQDIVHVSNPKKLDQTESKVKIVVNERLSLANDNRKTIHIENQIQKEDNTLPLIANKGEGNLIGQKIEREVFTIPKIAKKHFSINQVPRVLFAPDLIHEDASQTNGISLSILPTIGVSMLNTKGIQNHSLTELIDKEYGNAGVGMDVIFSKRLTNTLDFVFGVGIETINFTTEYDLALPYSEDEEVEDGNLGYIDFKHSLPTAFGNTDTGLRLSRVRNNSGSGESVVNLDFNTNHQFTVFSIPLGMNYRFGNERSFLGVNFLARPMYMLNGNSSIQSVVCHSTEIDAINNVSHSEYSSVNRFNMSLGINLGYHLSLDSNNGIALNVGYQEYMFDVYNSENYSTSLSQISASIGYTYSFIQQ